MRITIKSAEEGYGHLEVETYSYDANGIVLRSGDVARELFWNDALALAHGILALKSSQERPR